MFVPAMAALTAPKSADALFSVHVGLETPEKMSSSICISVK